MKAQADKMFDSEQYLQATSLYMRLLALQPKNLDYNYKYGTCLLFNSNRKQDAIKYLSFAVNDPSVVPEAYYFLGKALHMNYQFNEAIKQYQAYLEKRTGTGKMYDAEREIQMCQNGKRLMTTISDIIVTDKKEITIDKFFRIYELKDIGGNLLVTAEFQTKLDKKNNHTPLIHFPQNPSVIYYSSYGDNGANGKDIYVRRKLPDGSWGLPQPIPGNVNTKFDEDFPYMHPDGNYLYFSSKGHNSMGGYDVFRSKYDPENNTYGPPENMDFAISSPDDDLFYVVDSLNKDAYFASGRQSEMGKVFVYKVKVDRVPIQLVVIKGNFVDEVDPENKKINFEIRDYANGDVVGKFNSNDKSVYLITFPKGGKYEYIMNVEGSDQEFRSVVSLPFMKEFKPLKQKIIHTTEEGREIVKIINLFNEEVDDPQAVIAEVIKMRSELNVNVSDFDMEQLEKEREAKNVLKDLGMGDLLLVEVSDVLNQQVKKAKEGKNLVNTIENNINTLIVENSADFVRLEEQIKNKVAEANKVQNTESKYILLREADAMIKKQDELKRYSKSLIRLNDSIKGVVSNSAGNSDQAKLEEISRQFDQLYKEGKEDAALQVIAANKDLILKVLNDNSADFVQNLVDKVVKIDEEVSVMKAKVDTYNREMKDLEIEISALKNSIGSAKKKDLPAIEAKIAEKENELKLLEEEKIIVEKQIDVKSQEKYLLNKQIQVLQDAISNKSIASVSKEQASKAMAETEKTNSNTLTAYVAQQIAELERQDPSLKDRIIVSSGLKAQNIYEEFKASEQGIQDDPALSKEDKLYKLLSNERQALRQLDKRLEEIEALQVDNKYDENLNREKLALTSYRKEIEAQIENHEKQVEALVAKDGVADAGKVIESIDPEYEENKNFIASNANLSNEEKTQALNREDEKLLNSVEAELKKVDSQLIKTPEDKTLQTKQKTLNQIKTDTERSIEQRNKELASQGSSETLTSKNVIAQLDPNYENRKETINNNSSLSNDERLKALNSEDEKLLNTVNSELTKVNKQLAMVPLSTDLKARQEKLEQIKSETQAAIDQRKAELGSGSDIVKEPTVKDLIAQVSPQYDQRVEAISNNNSLSKQERVNALNSEDQELLNSINTELSKVDQQLSKDPSNTELKARKEKLEQIKAETQAAIDQRNKEIENLSDISEVVSVNEKISMIDPGYEERKNSVQASSTLSKEEQLKELNSIDQALIGKIDNELKTVEDKLENNPSDPKLQQEKNTLIEARKEKESDITEREKALSTESASEFSPETTKLIETIDPGYSKEIAEISENKELSSEDKLTKTQLRDKELLASIESKITTIDKQLVKDPQNKELQEQKQSLELLKTETEARISEREQLIESKLSSELTAENMAEQKELLKDKIDPSYDKKIAEARSKTGTELDKKTAELKVEQQLLEKITAEETAVKKILSKDPFNKDAKTRFMVLTDLKKDSQKNVDGLNSDIAALKSGQPMISVTEEDKKVKIGELAPAYTSIVDAVNSADIEPADKASQLMEEEKNLQKVTEERMVIVKEELTKEPSNRDLQKELKVLEEILKETEARIAEHQRTIDKANELPAVSESQKEEAVSKLDAEYADNVKAVESNQNLSETDKLQQIQTADQQLLSKVYDRQEKIDDQLSEDPSSKELKSEQQVLTVIANDLEKKIELRQQEINEKMVSVAVSEDERNIAITRIDPTYSNDISVIERLDLSEKEKLTKLQNEDRSLLTKVEDAIDQLERSLETDPSNTEKQRELQVLKAVRDELTKSIETREERLSSASEAVVSVSDEEKTSRIDAIDPVYNENRRSVENNTELVDANKANELLTIDNAMLDKVSSEKIEVKERLDKNPEDAQLKKDLAVLEAVEKDIEVKVQADKEAVSSAGQPEDLVALQSKIVAEVLPDYSSRKETIQISKMPEVKKVEEKLKLENELLTKLQAEEKAVRKALAKDPENRELQEKLTATEQLITQQKNEIDMLKTQQTELIAQEKKVTVIKDADANYSDDVQRLKESTSETKNSDLAEREVVHQERVSQQITENDKALAKKDNPTLKAENEVLKSELNESKEREDSYRKGVETPVVSSEAKEQYVSTLREDLLQGKTNELTAEYSTPEELKQQDLVLAEYETALTQQIAKKEELVQSEPENSSAKQELSYLKEELSTVQAKRRSVKITLGELEKIEVVQETSTNERFDDPELKKLGEQEAKLEQQLENPNLTKKEQQTIEKELAVVQEQKTQKENSLINEEIKQQDNEAKSLTTELKSSASVNEETQLISRSVTAQQSQLEKESDQLISEANATKNPEEKNYLLSQALVKQETANDIAKEAVVENRVEQLEQQNGIQSLETTAELEKQRRKYSIQIGELTKVIQEYDTQIPTAKGKEAEQLKEERQAKVEQRELVQQQLDQVNQQITAQENERRSVKPTTDPEAMKQEVSFQEEQEIASSDAYKNYSEKANAALQVEKQIATLEAQLNEERSQTKQLVAAVLDDPSDVNKAKLEENVQRVKQIESDLQTLKTELTSKQTLAQEALPTNTEEAMKMQNLVKRGIEPIQRLAIAAALVPLPANGLEINPNATAPNNMTAAIPVNVKNPTGLVYRVQVGAFAKPIPQDLFKEFNPVSGEKINENGVTRYMAGYFNSSQKVVEAREQIRALGYADAFAIAYCDGKRITLAEARIMEANGTCLPKGDNELIMEMAANTAVTIGLADTNKIPKVANYNYNQAPGAVKAEPIEKHLGLFFTVQVGVFNKPVNAKTVYNLAPLMTLRLPNGQIRYSAGVFNSVDEARPKKQEAINRGVKDAFITAYYNGQRITLAEAQQLLTDKGAAVLDNNMNKPATTVQTTTTQQTGQDQSTEVVEPLVEVKKERLQIVTKKTFDEFPREILNRYNSHGSFYYDENDKHVKSAIANSRDELPQVYYFKEDVDTVVTFDEVDEPGWTVTATFAGASLPGDFIDWILRFNYRREFTQTEEMIEMRLYRVSSEKLPELEAKLNEFGIPFKKETNTEND